MSNLEDNVRKLVEEMVNDSDNDDSESSSNRENVVNRYNSDTDDSNRHYHTLKTIECQSDKTAFSYPEETLHLENMTMRYGSQNTTEGHSDQNEYLNPEEELHPENTTMVVCEDVVNSISANMDIPSMPLQQSPENGQAHNDILTADVENITKAKRKGVRKVLRDPSTWKTAVLKKKHQSGQQYTSRQGKLVPKKQIRTLKNCLTNCRLKCATKISNDEREEIFSNNYKLNQNEKYHFLLNNTERILTQRPKRREENIDPYKSFSFKYFFNVKENHLQVCKTFFTSRLNISQKPIYNVHKKKTATNTPQPDMRGKTSRNNISDEIIEVVKEHIKSFPTVESHYCRAQTARLYLDSNLNVQKMYQLYVEKCKSLNTSPVKVSMYRHIFNTTFNLSFHVKKSDRCDLCEEYRVADEHKTVDEQLKIKFDRHKQQKDDMRADRKRDREQNEIPVLCFDLQNVITCPKAEVSSFYYRRKLNIYNLTAHYSQTKTVYCALWTETVSGRTGNDLASAFKKILDRVAEENHFTDLITWSDSCVPQNRNSFISCAVLNFIKENPHINSITMKYSVPGHSCIQEVDSAHSTIERGLSKQEFYSPLSLMRSLKTINTKNPMRVLQMTQDDFKDYGNASKHLKFSVIPFLQVKTLKFTQTLHIVSYRTEFGEGDMISENLRHKEKLRRSAGGCETSFLVPSVLKPNHSLTAPKIEDLKSMLKFMPLQDRQYYETVLKLK